MVVTRRMTKEGRREINLEAKEFVANNKTSSRPKAKKRGQKNYTRDRVITRSATNAVAKVEDDGLSVSRVEDDVLLVSVVEDDVILESKKKNCCISQTFETYDLVFAKLRGFRAWPAEIVEVSEKQYKVYFFGTYDFGFVTKRNLFKYTSDTLIKFGHVDEGKKWTIPFKNAINEICLKAASSSSA